MKLYAACLVKNEEDIIAQTLAHARRFCDRILVVDNGSTDRTWEIVQEITKADEGVVALAQKAEPYDEGLRWFAYTACHQELQDDDWWLILDGDEFLAENPRPIIEQASNEGADVINAWQIQFYYTEDDHRAWLENRDDRSRPINERRRYYRIDWQEPRLFRNRREPDVIFSQSKLLTPGSRWGESTRLRKGKVCRRRVFNRHYQYRDPIQIDQRLAIRYGQSAFAAQVPTRNWEEMVRPVKGLHYHRNGESWRFSVSGLIHYYVGWARYVLWSRARSLSQRIGRSGRPAGGGGGDAKIDG